MKRNEKQQTGRVNYIWVLAGGYLLYLGGKLLYGLYRDGGEGLSPVVAIAAAAVFAAVGIALLAREWKAYRYALAHKDDPSTWNDELADLAEGEEILGEETDRGTGEDLE